MIFNCKTFSGIRAEFLEIAANLRSRAATDEVRADEALAADLKVRASVWERAAQRVEMTTGYRDENKPFGHLDAV